MTILLGTFVSAKPLIEPDSNLSDSSAHLRTAGSMASISRTGFAIVTSTRQNKSHKKTRKCEKWETEPITNRSKCIKFIVVSKN